MFKAPITDAAPAADGNPQEGDYIGTENIGAIPFTGVILAHSNESEWQSFKSNKNNEAFIDRICVIEVPYCLRVTENERRRFLREAHLGIRARRRPLRAGNAGDARALLGDVASARARELDDLCKNAGL